MSTYIDIKFLNLLSSRLPKFKRKSENLFNFRCPHCGDSQKSQTKARGFVYRKKNDMFFKCHNCGVGQSLGNFIKFMDPLLHKEYVFERFKDGKVDLNKSEYFILTCLAVPTLFFGFYPDPLINTIEVSVNDLINMYNANLINK